MQTDASIGNTLGSAARADTDVTQTRAARSATEHRIALVHRWRMLPFQPAENDAAPRSIAEILQTVTDLADRPGRLLLGGGQLRDDLVELIGAVARIRAVDLYTSGNGFDRETIERLMRAGLQRLHVPFHCARRDAHDWLVGKPGALKLAHRTIRTCLEMDLPVVADVILTRPTAAHLAETVELLARTGARTICVRRLTAMDVEGTSFVPLSPRLSLIGKSLEEAATIALERRVRLTFRDLPQCTAPRLGPLFVAGDASPDATPTGCVSCPGPPRCTGAPADYAARFGWEEFFDPQPIACRVAETVEAQRSVPVTEPMAFSWRAARRIACEACAGESASLVAGTHEPTRVVRARLVDAARYRPSVLRIVGADALAHPQAAQLLFDAVRLFPNVEVAAEGSPIARWTDLDLRRLKELRRIDVALFGPDAAAHDAHCGIPGAFETMLQGLERLAAQPGIAVDVYAILHDASEVAAYAAGWEGGLLPGEPRFRLSARGSSLNALATATAALPEGATRTALAALLPVCLAEQVGLVARAEAIDAIDRSAPEQVIRNGRSIAYRPVATDLRGEFEACRICRIASCTGTAVGWQRE